MTKNYHFKIREGVIEKITPEPEKNIILIDNDLGLELKANRLEIYSKYVSENSSIPQIQGKFSFEFVEKTKITLLEDNVFIDKYVNLIYVKSDGYLYLSDDNSKVYYSRNYENSNGWIQLTNGKFIISLYGKYQPNLTIISKKRYNNLPWVTVDSSFFNLNVGEIKVVYGKFFVSKKGTNVFEIEDVRENATHLLLKDEWGGAFSSYRGGNIILLNPIYHRVAKSNGGGLGFDYGVIPIDKKYQISIEDI